MLINDKCVENFWKCPECGEEVVVNPDWYQDNGTPVCCACDADMEYDHTEIAGGDA